MFQAGSIPSGADVYLLSRVLHDWNDECALRLLAAVKEASAAPRESVSGPSCRRSLLVVIDRIATAANAHAMLSLHMNLLQGSRERWLSEWAALFERAGLRLASGSSEPLMHKDHAVFLLEL
jgi:hypothetical protein